MTNPAAVKRIKLKNINNFKDYYYLVGYIYADGHVNQKGKVFFCAAEKDKEFFFKLAKLLNIAVYNITKRIIKNKYISYRFSFYDKSFAQYLLNLGFIPRKSYENNDNVFMNIPNLYKSDFIRGFFDGDGSSMFNEKNKKLTGNFVSLNESLLRSIKKYIEGFYDNKNFGQLYLESGKYWRFRFSGNGNARKLYNILYVNVHDNNIFLKRKKNNFDMAIKYSDGLPEKKYYSFHKKSKKWRVVKSRNSKAIFVKTFLSEELAANFVKKNRQMLLAL